MIPCLVGMVVCLLHNYIQSWFDMKHCYGGRGVIFCGWGKLSVPPPDLLTWAVPVGLVLVPQIGFCFVGLGLPFFYISFMSFLSYLTLFSSSSSSLFLFLQLCSIHAQMPDWGRAFVHGHTFLHSWSGLMTLVVGLLHGAIFLSNLPLVLFLSLKWSY